MSTQETLKKEIKHCEKRISKYKAMKEEYLRKIEEGRLPEDSLRNAIEVCDHYISAIENKKQMLHS